MTRPEEQDTAPVEWIWWGRDEQDREHVSLGRWQKHPCQHRYKLAAIQPTEHDHRAVPPFPAGEAKTAEPVAWQRRIDAASDWMTVDDPNFYRRQGFEVRPLYDHPTDTEALRADVERLTARLTALEETNRKLKLARDEASDLATRSIRRMAEMAKPGWIGAMSARDAAVKERDEALARFAKVKRELEAFKAANDIGHPELGYAELVWRDARDFYEDEGNLVSKETHVAILARLADAEKRGAEMAELTQHVRNARIDEHRKAVAWLHARALEMNDPHAQQVLNSAAFSYGVARAALRAQEPGK